VARQFVGAQVLAIDLSLTSLAYAKRRADELGITNINFAQADILCLADLGKQFDVIQSTGVLHHLAEPMAGWKVLCDLLRLGGVMQIGLYSKLGRQHITSARNFIAARRHLPDADAIRQCRQELLASADDMLRCAALSRDFYGLGSCRDLLFHVQETALTLPEVKAFLDQRRLSFLGFEVDPSVTARFLSENSHDGALIDLGAWHMFELRYPETFFGMYQFWVQSTEVGQIAAPPQIRVQLS
jgi:SAM-dependent methyltransferase